MSNITCHECGTKAHAKTISDYKEWTIEFGDLEIPFPVEAFVCSLDTCQEIYINAGEIHKIEMFVKERIKDFTKKTPGYLLLSTRQTSTFLGITRQALNKKNCPVRRKTYQTEIDGTEYFLKESVEKYKKTGDGRYFLKQHEEIEHDALKSSLIKTYKPEMTLAVTNDMRESATAIFNQIKINAKTVTNPQKIKLHQGRQASILAMKTPLAIPKKGKPCREYGIC